MILQSFLPGILVIILYPVSKSEATSCNSFQDIFIKSFWCPNLQRAMTRKNEKGNNSKKKISPGYLLIILYQMSKCEAPSCNSL